MRVGINGCAFVNNLSSPENPFLNILKTSGGWGGDGDASPFNSYDDSNMNLDSNGYPTDFQVKTGSQAQTDGNVGFFDRFASVWRIRSVVNFLLYVAPGQTEAYPSGNYVLLWTGSGDPALNTSFDNATLVSSGANRKVYSITPTNPSSGIFLQISGANKTDSPGVTDIALIYSPDSTGGVVGTREALYLAGEVFDPTYISRVDPFDTFRFMDWMLTNRGSISTWSSRYAPANYHWAVAPIEVCVALCNKINANMWVCMPLLSDDTFVSNSADTALSGSTDARGRFWSGLNSNLKVYVEHGNENWNSSLGHPIDSIATLGYPIFTLRQTEHASFTGTISGTTLTVSGVSGTIVTTGTDTLNRVMGTGITSILRVTGGSGTTWTLSTSHGAVGPVAMGQGADFNCMLSYSGYRQVRDGLIWKNQWGAQSSRVRHVLAGQILASGGQQQLLTLSPNGSTAVTGSWGGPSVWYGTENRTAGAVCDCFTVAPYFASLPSGTLDDFFTAVWADLNGAGGPGANMDGYRNSIGDLVTYGYTNLEIVNYEGGQSYYPGGDSAKRTLYAQGNRDSRMGTAYQYMYLPMLKALNTSLFCHFNITGYYSDQTNSDNGNFGALETPQQAHTPKYDALINFINAEAGDLTHPPLGRSFIWK